MSEKIKSTTRHLKLSNISILIGACAFRAVMAVKTAKHSYASVFLIISLKPIN